MPSVKQHHSATTTKLLLIGESGAGKTGSLASLVAAGYNVRMLDFDNGADSLIALLTENPYTALIQKNKINIDTAFYYYTITEEMRRHPSESRFIPKSARGWSRMVEMTDNWIDGEIKLGGIDTWTDKDVLVIDTLGSLAQMCYNYVQQLNGRLGARMEGNEYRRDVGTAQNFLRALLQKLYSVHVKCNVIVVSHITAVDDSLGVAAMPRTGENPTARINLKGYPAAIGRSLSPEIGKYFNNLLKVESSGSGANVRHEIYTVPNDSVAVKSARVLDQRYSVQSGLAEIFAALRGEPAPKELIEALGGQRRAAAPSSPTLQRATR